jgi:hypothetical protein
MQIDRNTLGRDRSATESTALLSIRDFAKQMGCSVSLARKLCYGRKVAHVKFSRNLMVPVGEVDRLIAENLTPALRAENMPDGCRSDAGVETERPKVGGIGEAPIEHSRPKEKDSTAPKSREAGSNSPSSAEPRALGLSLGMGLLRRRGRLA